ncbi:PKD domain-containing protein [Microbulbifer sp. Q7]|uniref:PKD domain-containing protein n=1 Tax=Microbulbifer sp. Q7 TaxID=1785091 RepID=UPI00082CDF73|nr:PKD domain-containing protein [Microbulbifer sp. Q7]
MGAFEYQPDDNITFTLGSITFPELPAQPVMTPLDLFSATDFSDPALVNTLVLLQSLDDDGDIQDHINISAVRADAVTSAGLELSDLDQPYAEFVTSEKVQALLEALGVDALRVSRLNAILHFERALADSPILDIDGDGLANVDDPDDDNDGTIDALDHLPWNPQEQDDFDGDRIGDNTDTDDDADGLEDALDEHREFVVISRSDLGSAAHSFVDAQHNLLYVSIKDRNALDVLDLKSGEVVQTLAFDKMPERMTASSDGSKLYIALLEREHSSYWWDEDQIGYVAIVDLNSRKVVKTLTLKVDPYDLVVTDNGKLIITPGSGQWGNIIAFDADTGAELARAGNIYQRSQIAILPSEQSLFTVRDSSSRIDKFDFSGAGITRISDVPHSYEHRMGYDIWATPDEKYLLAGAGDLYNANDLSFVKSIAPLSKLIIAVHFDTLQNLAWVVLSDSSVLILNLTTFEVIASDVVLGSVIGMATDATTITYFILDRGELITLRKPHPCTRCFENTAPMAQFGFTPTNGDTTDTYVFDASLSDDAETGESLKYRWDIDNDGQWETGFSPEALFEHRFRIAGSRFVRLQVKDQGGLVASTIKSINVIQGVDSGIVVDDSVADSLNFDVTQVLEDRARGLLYISDKSAKRLYVVNLASGLTERYFEFDLMPERMAMTPDGSKMYLALLAQEHSSYWWDEDQYGYIAQFDLEILAHTKTLKVDVDPFDLVATDAGKLIIASGSGQWTNIFAYDAETGGLLGSSSIRQASRLSLHPSQDWVFAATTDSSPSDFSKFDIRGAGIELVGDSPYHGDHRVRGGVWVTPDGNYLVSRGGDIFKTSDMTYVASMTSESVYIDQLIFDEVENTVFAVTTENNIQYFNMSSWMPVGTLASAVGTEWLSIIDDELVAVADSGSGYQLVSSAHPCIGCGANTPPVSVFSVNAGAATTVAVHIFDASASSDAEDGSALSYRWDFDGDGSWDAEFSSSATREHKYVLAGSYPVRLQVRDSGGLVATSTQNIVVEQGIDPGIPVTDSIPYQLDFSATDMEVDLARSKAYISDKSARRLYVVDLLTGLTERYFEFEQMPERLTMTPDGNKLYLALLVQEHSSYWWEEEQYGYIAEFDLELQSQVNTLLVSVDPYDLVATDGGKLVVSSGSGQWTYIHAYDVSSGALLGSSSIRQASRLALHPSQEAVFAADTDVSPSDIEKFDISGSGISNLGDSPYHGSHRMRGNVWATPDGSYVITRGGDLFRASDMEFVAELTGTGILIEQLFFDVTEDMAFALLSDGTAQYFNMTSWLPVGSLAVAADTQFIAAVGSSVFTVVEGGASSQLNETAHPCVGCGSSSPPTASFSYGPDAGTTADDFMFDASASVDAEDGTNLRFRWDIDGDGQWDNGFSTIATLEHRFLLSGNVTVRLQVVDSAGYTATAQQQISVTQGTDTGTAVSDSTAYELNFAITDHVADPARDKAYFSDKSAQRLYVVDLISGLTERYFELPFMPDQLAITPDGSKLYLALLAHAHSGTRWEQDQFGYVAEFDLELQAHTNTLAVGIDPYDLIATDDGLMAISSGSGQWTEIHLYDTATGSKLGSTGIRHRSRLALHPSQNAVFAADTDLSPSDIEKFSISSAGIVSEGDSPYHGDHRMAGNVWATPDSQHVVTRGGDVFLASDLTYVLSMTSAGAGVEQVAFDPATGSLHAIGMDGILYEYDYLSSFELLGTDASYTDPKYLLQGSGQLYVVLPDGIGHRLQQVTE